MESKTILHRQEICDFFAEYSSWLMGSQATCIRIEKNLGRMSKAFGVRADINITPSHIYISVDGDEHHRPFVCVRRVPKMPVSFAINTSLSRLSWNVADGLLNFEQACAEFEKIKKNEPEDYRLVMVLVSFANMSFCRLFGGDAISMAIVFVATFFGYLVKVEMLKRKLDIRLIFITCALTSSVLASTADLFGWGDTPQIALGTSVLYLIPGIPYINSVSDLLDGHYLCSISRFIDAITLTACLSVGLYLGVIFMGLSFF